MASSAVWQNPKTHQPDNLPDTHFPLEPKALDQTQEFAVAFDAWLNAVPSELQSSSIYTDPIPPKVSDSAFLLTPDLTPPPAIGEYLYDEPIANGVQQCSDVDVRVSQFQARPRRAKLSTSSWDTSYSQDESCQRFACPECSQAFENLSALDKHTQSTSHKAWQCREAGCEKTYARRDTFLRHRVTHRADALSHACLVCSQAHKRKTFKRKDHLRDHMRNCHSEGIESRRSSHDSSATNPGSDYGSMDTSVDSQVSTPVQKQAMGELVRCLGTVLGERNKCLMGDLGDKMTALSGPDMESIAQGMAGIALAKTIFSNSDAKL